MAMVGIVLIVLAAAILIMPLIPVKDEHGNWTTMWDDTDTTSDC